MTIFDEVEQQSIEKGIEKSAVKLWKKGIEPNMIANLLDLSLERVKVIIASNPSKN